MAIEILMPALSPTMEEGTLAKWLVDEGTAVRSGDVIAEIETDKATMEVEALDDGTIGRIIVPAGTEGLGFFVVGLYLAALTSSDRLSSLLSASGSLDSTSFWMSSARWSRTLTPSGPGVEK